MLDSRIKSKLFFVILFPILVLTGEPVGLLTSDIGTHKDREHDKISIYTGKRSRE